jgi:predicted RNase H-like HicB family nuclease
MSEHCSANIFWHEESNCWVAVCPEFPGSSAVGDTRMEALTELEDCIEGWVEAYQADGRSIPTIEIDRDLKSRKI